MWKEVHKPVDVIGKKFRVLKKSDLFPSDFQVVDGLDHVLLIDEGLEKRLVTMQDVTTAWLINRWLTLDTGDTKPPRGIFDRSS